MSYPFEDKTALKHRKENKEQSIEEVIYLHDIKLLELDTRLRSLEALVNFIHNYIPVWWDKEKPE